MTISSDAIRVDFEGTQPPVFTFPVPFRFLDDENLLVLRTNLESGITTTLILSSIAADGFTAIGANDPNGGTITLNTGLMPGNRLTILANAPTTQLTDYIRNDPFPAESHERALDKLTLVAKGVRESLTRAFTFPPGLIGISTAFPFPESLKGLRWNSSETAIENFEITGFSAPGGADLIGFQQELFGAVPRTLAEKLFEEISTDDFGVPKDGSTDSTFKFNQFKDALLLTGRRGYINPGAYVFTKGGVVFDNGNVNRSFPFIRTDGPQFVSIRPVGSVNAPLIQILGGSIASGGNTFWNSGFLGGFTIIGDNAPYNVENAGIRLRGVQNLRVGHIRANNLSGDVVHLPNAVIGGTNPDPFNVANLVIDTIEGNFCKGMLLNNLNHVGLAGFDCGFMRAIQCERGVWFGFGSASTVNAISVGSCLGWSLDDGTQIGNPTTANRVHIGLCELDDAQFGIRLSRTQGVTIDRVRFVHRRNGSPLNQSGLYFPRIAIDINGGILPATRSVRINATHRIEAGGVKADVGVFSDYHSNANIADVHVDHDLTDNAGIGFIDTDLFINTNANMDHQITRVGMKINDTQFQEFVLANTNGTVVVPSGGYTTPANDIPFAAEASDRRILFNSPFFTAKYDGFVRITAQLGLSTTANVRIQMGVRRITTGGVSIMALNTRQFQAVTGILQTYVVNGIVPCLAGDRFALNMDNDSGAGLPEAIFGSLAADNRITFEHVTK